MLVFLRHLFFPHHTNNQRAKLLHYDSLLIIAFIFFVATFFLSSLNSVNSSVLGSAVNISSQELLILTNQERQKFNLLPLHENTLLESAAFAKANDMFKDNYWAHISPVTGRTPWDYIQNQGYQYTYAGENLARGYTSTEDVVKAWMDSPSHRANVLSKNYQDVGFAIREGVLTGERDTVLVVEMFGGKGSAPLAKVNSGGSPMVLDVLAEGLNSKLSPESLVSAPIIDKFSLAKLVAQFLLGLFVILFILDSIIIERKKISRIVSHNLDHVLFFLAIFIIVILLESGSII